MILLVPIGPVPLDLLTWLATRLCKITRFTIDVGSAIPLPRKGHDLQRQQYEAEPIMEAMARLDHPEAERLVGLIDADCRAAGLNFIFGQASVNGREAFVAMPRLRPSFYGQIEDKTVFRGRILKEVLHELGHTWGLGHCTSARCVMHFSNTLNDTDVKEAGFCRHCRQQIKASR